MPADAAIDQRGPRLFNRFCQHNGFIKGIAAFHQIKHRQAVNNNKIAAHRRPYRLNDGDGKTLTIFAAATPVVLPLIGA